MISISYTCAQLLIYGFAILQSEIEIFKWLGAFLIIIGAAMIKPKDEHKCCGKHGEQNED